MSGRGRGRGKFTPPTGARLQLQKAAEECGFDARNLRSLQSRPETFPDIALHSSGLPMHLILKRQEQEVPEQENAEHQGKDGNVTIKMENDSKLDRQGKNTIKTVKRSAKTAKLIQKGREMHHRMQNSPFFVRYNKDIPDVIRYSDTVVSEKPVDDNDTDPFAARDNSLNAVKAVMVHCLGGRKATRQGLFLPDELVYGPKRLTKLGWMNDEEDEANKKITLEDLEKQEKLKERRIRLGLDQVEDEERVETEFVEDDLGEEPEEQDDGGYGVNYYESEGEESAGDGVGGEAYI